MDRCFPYCLVLFCIFSQALCSEIDLTVDIPAGRQECFFQELPAATVCEIDYQVSFVQYCHVS